MCRTGHSYIKMKMKEIDAILGGEMSGHIFFKDRWFGFDDGISVGSVDDCDEGMKLGTRLGIAEMLGDDDGLCGVE